LALSLQNFLVTLVVRCVWPRSFSQFFGSQFGTNDDGDDDGDDGDDKGKIRRYKTLFPCDR
jgi:hypothetical protein